MLKLDKMKNENQNPQKKITSIKDLELEQLILKLNPHFAFTSSTVCSTYLTHIYLNNERCLMRSPFDMCDFRSELILGAFYCATIAFFIMSMNLDRTITKESTDKKIEAGIEKFDRYRRIATIILCLTGLLYLEFFLD